MDEDIPDLAKRLRRARAKRGLTQLQMSERCGVTQSAVSQWESGSVPRGHVEAVEREYGVRVTRDDLIRRTDA